MKVLFLDDNEARQTAARDKLYPNEDVIQATDAASAIFYLNFWRSKHWRFDLVSLDHDLGGQIYQDSRDITSGMEVVRAMCKKHYDVSYVLIHSWNATAAKEMKLRLEEHGYRVLVEPFRVPSQLIRISA